MAGQQEEEDKKLNEFLGPKKTRISLTSKNIQVLVPEIPGTTLYVRTIIPLEKLIDLEWHNVNDNVLQLLVTTLQSESDRRQVLGNNIRP